MRSTLCVFSRSCWLALLMVWCYLLCWVLSYVVCSHSSLFAVLVCSLFPLALVVLFTLCDCFMCFTAMCVLCFPRFHVFYALALMVYWRIGLGYCCAVSGYCKGTLPEVYYEDWLFSVYGIIHSCVGWERLCSCAVVFSLFTLLTCSEGSLIAYKVWGSLYG
jgi:hypothetical protein